MAEVLFARTFLATLDSRPIKLPADHVEDPRNYPARQPVSPFFPPICAPPPFHRESEADTIAEQFILPRMPTAMSKPANLLAPGQERSVKVTLKSLRNPPLDIVLPSTPAGTSIHDIKADVSRRARIPVDKLKILHNKKPVTDTKVLKDLVGEADTAVEFSVMVIGGAAAVLPEESAKPAISEVPTGAAALETDAFWSDLKGFLSQRLKDDAQARELSSLFKTSWESRTSNP